MSSYIALESQTLGSAASSVTFSNIPTTKNGKTLRDLVLVTSVRTDTTSYVVSGLLFNGGESSFTIVTALGDGSATVSYTETGGSSDQIARSNAATGFYTPVLYNIMDFAQTDKQKTILYKNAGGNNNISLMGAMRWASTSAISSIQIYTTAGNYVAGSTFSLYGIEG